MDSRFLKQKSIPHKFSQDYVVRVLQLLTVVGSIADVGQQ